MNITDFKARYNQIVNNTKSVLDHSYLPCTKLLRCIEAINALQSLIQADAPQPPIKDWHAAKRIICYHEIKKNLMSIQTNNAIKSMKIQIDVNILSINRQIEKIKQFIASNIRLPFKVGPSRETYYTNIKRGLKLSDTKRVHIAEREYFHLLGDNLSLTGIDKEHYEGASEIQSLKSWKSVLKQFIEEGNSQDQEAAALLALINKAIPIALKTSFVVKFPKDDKEEEVEMNYFTALSKCKKTTFETNSQSALYQQFELLPGYQIPQVVIINEIAWDIMESINQLKDKEDALFILGTHEHAVAVKIQCTGHAEDPGKRIYDYKIYNTGHKVATYHLVIQSLDKAYPLTFEGVSRAGMPYAFISNLIKISKDSTNIHEFYSLHDEYLIKKGQGTKVMDKGLMYDKQKQAGVCTYKCVEAVIHEGLADEGKIQRFEELKSRKAIAKFEKTVQIVAKHQLKSKMSKTTDKKRKSKSLSGQPPGKRLKSNQSLLELGQAYQASQARVLAAQTNFNAEDDYLYSF